jgi:chitosanase
MWRGAVPTRASLVAVAAVVLAAGCTTLPQGTAVRRVAAPAATPTGLDRPWAKEIAMELVSSAENSTLDWRSAYSYIEDIGDGRGYTAGLIGFCSGTGDLLRVVVAYDRRDPDNPLAPFTAALRRVNGTASHAGLGREFVRAWKRAAKDPLFRRLQDRERDRSYFDPAVRRGKSDGLGTLGQFIYYDAMVMHGPGADRTSFGGIRAAARREAATPADGGDQVAYLNAFLDVRRKVMKSTRGWRDTSRIDEEQRRFLDERNLGLRPPLVWHTYGDRYEIRRPGSVAPGG